MNKKWTKKKLMQVKFEKSMSFHLIFKNKKYYKIDNEI